jgi:hypothetical protein
MVIGRFHLIAALMVIPALMCGDLQINNLAYFELWPTYECQYTINDYTSPWEVCVPSEFCDFTKNKPKASINVSINMDSL